MTQDTKKNKKKFTFDDKAKQILKHTLSAVALLFLLISFFKVPYVGVFLDSTLFSFLFGWTKYLIYLFLMVFCLSINFVGWKQKLFKKHYVIYFFLFVLSLSICLSSISVYYNSSWNLSFDQFYINKSVNSLGYISDWHSDIWTTQLINYKTIANYADLLNPTISAWGGLIGIFVVSISTYIIPIIIIIFIITIGVVLSLWKHNPKFKSFVQSKFTKVSFINQDKQETKEESNEEVSNSTPEEEINKLEPLPTYYDINSLEDNSFDDAMTLKEVTDDVKNKIENVLKQLVSNVAFNSIVIGYQSSNIEFNVLNEINQNKALESTVLFENIIKFNDLISKIEINSKDNGVLEFNIIFAKKGIISIKELLLNKPKNHFLELAVGKTVNRQDVFINTFENSTQVILGQHGSGRVVLISQLILSALLTYSPKELQLVIYEEESKNFKQFYDYKYLNNFSNVSELNNYLQSLKSEMKLIKKKLINAKVDDVLAYNSIHEDKIRTRLILINDFNLYLEKSSDSEIKLFKLLLERSSKFGFNFILTSEQNFKIMQEYRELAGVDIILKTDTVEESVELTGNSKSFYLSGSGDMLLRFKNHPSWFRAQSSYSNRKTTSDLIQKLNEIDNNEL